VVRRTRQQASGCDGASRQREERYLERAHNKSLRAVVGAGKMQKRKGDISAHEVLILIL
jgi:hypothetical protein